MNIEKSLIEQLHEQNGLAFDREAYSEGAIVARRLDAEARLNESKPAAHFKFTLAQDQDTPKVFTPDYLGGRRFTDAGELYIGQTGAILFAQAVKSDQRFFGNRYDGQVHPVKLAA